MSKIDEARTAWSNAVERMEDLDIQLQGLTDDSEPEIVQALEERFADAKAEALRKRTTTSARRSSRASGRSNCPTSPTAERRRRVERLPGRGHRHAAAHRRPDLGQQGREHVPARQLQRGLLLPGPVQRPRQR
jgi:hypothetical protein